VPLRQFAGTPERSHYNPLMDYGERSLIIHEQLRGKIAVSSKLPIDTEDDLSIAYTPGVARPCEVIAENPERARDLTM